jgi:hypothetical protein
MLPLFARVLRHDRRFGCAAGLVGVVLVPGRCRLDQRELLFWLYESALNRLDVHLGTPDQTTRAVFPASRVIGYLDAGVRLRARES